MAFSTGSLNRKLPEWDVGDLYDTQAIEGFRQVLQADRLLNIVAVGLWIIL